MGHKYGVPLSMPMLDIANRFLNTSQFCLMQAQSAQCSIPGGFLTVGENHCEALSYLFSLIEN